MAIWFLFFLSSFGKKGKEEGGGGGGQTPVDEAVDLLLGHAGALDGAEGALLLLPPVVDEVGVLGIAGFSSVRLPMEYIL